MFRFEVPIANIHHFFINSVTSDSFPWVHRNFRFLFWSFHYLEHCLLLEHWYPLFHYFSIFSRWLNLERDIRVNFNIIENRRLFYKTDTFCSHTGTLQIPVISIVFSGFNLYMSTFVHFLNQLVTFIFRRINNLKFFCWVYILLCIFYLCLKLSQPYNLKSL